MTIIFIQGVQADIGIKEIGSLLDVASKDEGILLITLEVVVNGIKKTVNKEVYEAEKVRISNTMRNYSIDGKMQN